MRELRRACGLLVGLAVLTAGCNRQDTERLGRIGRRALEEAEVLTCTCRDGLTGGWQGGGPDGAALQARVATRLRWDKTLAQAPIQVGGQGSTVELKGMVQDLTQRRRAV